MGPRPGDRRRSLVLLTARARAIEQELVAVAQEVNAVATRGLDPAGFASFMATMAAVIANLEHIERAADHE